MSSKEGPKVKLMFEVAIWDAGRREVEEPGSSTKEGEERENPRPV